MIFILFHLELFDFDSFHIINARQKRGHICLFGFFLRPGLHCVRRLVHPLPAPSPPVRQTNPVKVRHAPVGHKVLDREKYKVIFSYFLVCKLLKK